VTLFICDDCLIFIFRWIFSTPTIDKEPKNYLSTAKDPFEISLSNGSFAVPKPYMLLDFFPMHHAPQRKSVTPFAPHGAFHLR